MSFISSSAHQKFVTQCQSFIAGTVDAKHGVAKNEKIDKLTADLEQLQELAEAYTSMLSKLPAVSVEYYNLHRRIRINLRRMQMGLKRK